MKKILLILLLFFILSDAKSLEMNIGSVRLSIGSDKSTTLNQLKASFHVIPVKGDNDTYILSEDGPPNIDVVGSVGFENNRLSYIQRDWGDFDTNTNAVDFSKSLYNAIVNATENSGSEVIITSETKRIPGAEFRTLNFNYNNRRVFILITDGDTNFGQRVSIGEGYPSFLITP